MDYSRQFGVFQPEDFTFPVHIIGTGATGSWVAVMLAKMGVRDIHLHDFDTVEEHNVPNQLFRVSDVGESKVVACANMVKMTSGINAKRYNAPVTGDDSLSGIVFVLTDSMSSRSEIYKKALRNNIHVPLVIETRMGGEGGRVYAINPCDRKQSAGYQKTLYSDDEAVVSECGVSQSMAPTAAFIASLAVWQLIKFHNGKDIDQEIIVDISNNTYLTRNL